MVIMVKCYGLVLFGVGIIIVKVFLINIINVVSKFKCVVKVK